MFGLKSEYFGIVYEPKEVVVSLQRFIKYAGSIFNEAKV